uniref:Carboxylic ester hydrolase n=1 Tax=Strongyloides papillosus TaxID=174720 RepID=A0A0N5CFC7_STREA
MGNSLDHLFKGKEVEGRRIETKYGPVIGKRIINDKDKEVDAFLGIPFAKPPIGELRFQKPVPPDSWTEPRRCFKFASRSIQKDMFFWQKYSLMDTSEDCLYLNVFAPVNGPSSDFPKGYPVMVFIHGGGFVCDSSVKYGDIGISKHLVSDKGVIVVTIQYRLGYLGFFSTGDDVCPGNNGLWDMTLALKWIQNNIPNFGGDKDNVTIFGQSAGGCAVELLALSPHSQHLFHKIIPMGGNSQCNWSLNKKVVEICYNFATKHGIFTRDSKDLLNELRNLPANKFGTSLQLSTSDISAIAKPTTEIGPRIDGDFLPESLEKLQKKSIPKPKIIGLCEAEGLIFQLFMKTHHVGKLEDIIATIIPETDFPNFKELRSKALKLYMSEDFDNKSKGLFNRQVGKFFSDLFVGIGTKLSILRCIESGVEPYVYIFEHFNPKQFGILSLKIPYKAATHCWDISYVVKVGIVVNWEFTKEDLIIVDYMTTFWANFAKYGNPNGINESNVPVQWEPATKDNPNRCLRIKLEPEMSETFFDNTSDFWLELDKYKNLSN